MTVDAQDSPIATVPVIDLNKPEEELVALVRFAGLQHGFFYVVNHGIPDEVTEDHLLAAQSFFKLPVEEKMKLKGRDFQGYIPLGDGNLDEHGGGIKLELREQYIVNADTAETPDEPRALLPFRFPNELPPASILPDFKNAIYGYIAEQTKLMHRINRLIALSLDLPGDYFEDKFDDAVRKAMMIHYLEGKSDVSKGIIAVGGHRDFGMSTILWTDGTPGLQVLYGDAWVDVPPMPGAFVVNLADMLARWTNGKYKSSLHRVNKTVNRERFATAFFVNPNHDAMIECLPTCLEEGEAPKYSPITVDEYYKMRLTAFLKPLPGAKEVLAGMGH